MSLTKGDILPKVDISTSSSKRKIIFILITAVLTGGGIDYVVHQVPGLIHNVNDGEATASPASKESKSKRAPDTPIQPQSQSQTQSEAWKSKPNIISQQNSSPTVGDQDLASFDMNREDLKKEREANKQAQISPTDPPSINEALNARHLKEEADESEDYLDARKKAAKSPYELQAGSVIPAVLNSAINSDQPGFVTAVVAQNVYDTVSGSFLLIPKGTKLFGKYSSGIGYGQQRLNISWNRLIFSDGSSLSLRKMNGNNGADGVDREGSSGFSDIVDNHMASVFSSAILMSLVGAGAQISQPQNATSGVGLSQNQTMGQTMAGQLGQQLSSTSGRIIEKNLNVPPTITIRAGYEFNVMVNKDVVLEPVVDDED